MAKKPLTPAKVMELGTGFFGSKTLLSAIELGLFTELAKGARTAEDLTARLGLHPRSARDFFRRAGRAGHAEAHGDAVREYAGNGAVPRPGQEIGRAHV